MKVFFKLVIFEKKGKSKGRKSKKVIVLVEKRRNSSRKVRRSNEENIRKDESEIDVFFMFVSKN